MQTASKSSLLKINLLYNFFGNLKIIFRNAGKVILSIHDYEKVILGEGGGGGSV